MPTAGGGEEEGEFGEVGLEVAVAAIVVSAGAGRDIVGGRDGALLLLLLLLGINKLLLLLSDCIIHGDQHFH